MSPSPEGTGYVLLKNDTAMFFIIIAVVIFINSMAN